MANILSIFLFSACCETPVFGVRRLDAAFAGIGRLPRCFYYCTLFQLHPAVQESGVKPPHSKKPAAEKIRIPVIGSNLAGFDKMLSKAR